MSAPARACPVWLETTPSKVLEALRRHEHDYVARHGLDPTRIHVLHQLFACRTAKLGTHPCVCEGCGYSALAYNSCRNRHCPQCQGHATAQWLEARTERMLPTPHFQVVFTLPAELRPLAFGHQKLVYDLLFRTAASVLRDLAAQRLDARLGITAVLHTWTSELFYHPHVHFLVSAGGLSLDGKRWIPTRENYLFPGKILGTMFRGRLLDGLIAALDRGDFDLADSALSSMRAMLRKVAKRHSHFIVHVEPPNGRPVEAVTKYLARYVKRVAISDARILALTDTAITFRTRRGPVTLEGQEFVRRFLLHVLPKGLRKVRHYGLYAPGASAGLDAARALLPSLPDTDRAATRERGDHDASPEPPEHQVCPACGQSRLQHRFGHPSPVLPLRVPP